MSVSKPKVLHIGFCTFFFKLQCPKTNEDPHQLQMSLIPLLTKVPPKKYLWQIFQNYPFLLLFLPAPDQLSNQIQLLYYTLTEPKSRSSRSSDQKLQFYPLSGGLALWPALGVAPIATRMLIRIHISLKICNFWWGLREKSGLSASRLPYRGGRSTWDQKKWL